VAVCRRPVDDGLRRDTRRRSPGACHLGSQRRMILNERGRPHGRMRHALAAVPHAPTAHAARPPVCGGACRRHGPGRLKRQRGCAHGRCWQARPQHRRAPAAACRAAGAPRRDRRRRPCRPPARPGARRWAHARPRAPARGAGGLTSVAASCSPAWPLPRQLADRLHAVNAALQRQGRRPAAARTFPGEAATRTCASGQALKHAARQARAYKQKQRTVAHSQKEHLAAQRESA